MLGHLLSHTIFILFVNKRMLTYIIFKKGFVSYQSNIFEKMQSGNALIITIQTNENDISSLFSASKQLATSKWHMPHSYSSHSQSMVGFELK